MMLYAILFYLLFTENLIFLESCVALTADTKSFLLVRIILFVFELIVIFITL